MTLCYTSQSHVDGEDVGQKQNPFLLLPVQGDLALVDAIHGVKLCTIRGDIADTGEDDEDDGVDQEAITAYALASNDQFVVTCTRNHTLRQYSIDRITKTAAESKEGSGNAAPPPSPLPKSIESYRFSRTMR